MWLSTIFLLVLFWHSLRQLKSSQPALAFRFSTSEESWHFLQAKHHLARYIGLLNHASLPDRTGLILTHTRTIHTQGMAFAIDAVGFTKQGQLTALFHDLKPGLSRVAFPRKTHFVLEIQAGQRWPAWSELTPLLQSQSTNKSTPVKLTGWSSPTTDLCNPHTARIPCSLLQPSFVHLYC